VKLVGLGGGNALPVSDFPVRPSTAPINSLYV
jgi:hypothetical protein